MCADDGRKLPWLLSILNSPDPDCPDIGLSHSMAEGCMYQKGLGVGSKDSKSEEVKEIEIYFSHVKVKTGWSRARVAVVLLKVLKDPDSFHLTAPQPPGCCDLPPTV